MKYEIEYEPRIQDPVIVARFNSLEEAEAYMEVIKVKHPRFIRKDDFVIVPLKEKKIF